MINYLPTQHTIAHTIGSKHTKMVVDLLEIFISGLLIIQIIKNKESGDRGARLLRSVTHNWRQISAISTILQCVVELFAVSKFRTITHHIPKPLSHLNNEERSVTYSLPSSCSFSSSHSSYHSALHLPSCVSFSYVLHSRTPYLSNILDALFCLSCLKSAILLIALPCRLLFWPSKYPCPFRISTRPQNGLHFIM